MLPDGEDNVRRPNSSDISATIMSELFDTQVKAPDGSFHYDESRGGFDNAKRVLGDAFFDSAEHFPHAKKDRGQYINFLTTIVNAVQIAQREDPNAKPNEIAEYVGKAFERTEFLD